MSDARARLFVALQLPADPRAALERWQAHALAGLKGIRPVAPEALHVTLCFLGARAIAEIDSILTACETVADTPAGLSLDQAVWLPARRPRVLAVSVDDPHGALAALQESLSAVLAAGGWYAPETRRFLPHVTVGRVVKNARARPVEVAPPPPLSLDGARVTLYRSILGRGGARYEALQKQIPGSPGNTPESAAVTLALTTSPGLIVPH